MKPEFHRRCATLGSRVLQRRPQKVRILIFCPFGRRGLDGNFDGGPFLGGGDPAAGNRATGGRDDWRGGDEHCDAEILPSDACYSTPCCYVLARISDGKEGLLKGFQDSTFACDRMDFLPVVLDPPRNGSDLKPAPPVILGKGHTRVSSDFHSRAVLEFQTLQSIKEAGVMQKSRSVE
ncbi:hypothetical protein OROHE_023660 [Orobanche hederae]